MTLSAELQTRCRTILLRCEEFNSYNSLFAEIIFNRDDVAPVEKAIFQQLKSVFPENEIENWLSHYVEHREGWKPRAHSHDTIRSLIRPQFFSVDFLTSDDQICIDTWDHLSKSGCVMVMAAISLFHSLIYRRLLQSEMSAHPQVAFALLILAPEASQTNILIEQEIRSRLERAFVRFDRYDDKFCQLDVGRQRDLRRWLVATLPEVVRKICLTPHFTGRQIMQKRISQTHGMATLSQDNGGRQ